MMDLYVKYESRPTRITLQNNICQISLSIYIFILWLQPGWPNFKLNGGRMSGLGFVCVCVCEREVGRCTHVAQTLLSWVHVLHMYLMYIFLSLCNVHATCVCGACMCLRQRKREPTTCVWKNLWLLEGEGRTNKCDVAINVMGLAQAARV